MSKQTMDADNSTGNRCAGLAPDLTRASLKISKGPRSRPRHVGTIRYFTDNNASNRVEYGHSDPSEHLNGLHGGHDARTRLCRPAIRTALALMRRSNCSNVIVMLDVRDAIRREGEMPCRLRAKRPFKKANEENYSGASKPSLSKATAPRFQE
jgi:hypothetical protein